MRRVVVSSHGELAKGMESTLSFFVDSNYDINYICGYTDGLTLESKIEQYFKSVSPGDEIIILTDLLGGSVNAAFLPYLEHPGIHLIAGFNLGLVLELLALEESASLEEVIPEAVENAKSGMVYVNTYKVSFNGDDDL